MIKRRFKIIYLIDQLRIGGTENQFVEIVNRLDYRKFNVEVVTLKKKGNIIAHKIRNSKKTLSIEKILHPLTIYKILKFAAYLRNERVSIMQTFFPEGTFLGTFAARIARVPVIVATRREISSWHNTINKASLKISNKFAHRILANSYAVANYLIKEEKVDPNVIDIIYNGIDSNLPITRLHSMPQRSNTITIGVVANFLRPVKRFDLFVESAIILSQRFRRIVFLVIGVVDKSLLNLIPPELFDHFRFTGSVKDVRPLLDQVDIGILCSDSEGFSNVILEYMSCSVPCVATAAGGNIEIIEDGVDGFLFRQGDAKSLAEKVGFLVENPSIRTQFAHRAKEKVEKYYNWPVIIGKYEKYYHDLLTHHGCRLRKP